MLDKFKDNTKLMTIKLEININIFTHGLLCVLFLNVLHDTIYSKCVRVRQPSSFSQFYDTYNQSV